MKGNVSAFCQDVIGFDEEIFCSFCLSWLDLNQVINKYKWIVTTTSWPFHYLEFINTKDISSGPQKIYHSSLLEHLLKIEYDLSWSYKNGKVLGSLIGIPGLQDEWVPLVVSTSPIPHPPSWHTKPWKQQ